jgi:hypothetical protein
VKEDIPIFNHQTDQILDIAGAAEQEATMLQQVIEKSIMTWMVWAIL